MDQLKKIAATPIPYLPFNVGQGVVIAVIAIGAVIAAKKFAPAPVKAAL